MGMWADERGWWTLVVGRGWWLVVVGVTAAIRGGRSGAMLVGRTAAVGVLSSETKNLVTIPKIEKKVS